MTQQDAIATNDRHQLPDARAPNREVLRPDRPANPRGYPVAREPVLNPRLVGGGRGVGVPVVGGAGRAPAEAAIPRRNHYVVGVGTGANYGATPGVGAAQRPVVSGAGRVPAVAATASCVQPERGVAAGGNEVATPSVVTAIRAIGTTPAREPSINSMRVATSATGAVEVSTVSGAGRAPAVAVTARHRTMADLLADADRQFATPGVVMARRAITTTPTVGEPVVGGATPPVLPAMTLAEALAEVDAAAIEAATPATGAAQQAQPSENAEADTLPARPASPFSQSNFDQKIQALLDAADNQIKRAAAYDASYLDIVTTQVGSRNLTAKECLGFALEIALENRRAQVPDISLRLTRILNAGDQIIPLFGVNFPRARIEAWSKEESLPEPIQVHQEFKTKDNQLGTAWAGSVHSDPVTAVGKKQLKVMEDRTAIGSRKTVEQTATEIRQYIATLPPSKDALRGLNKIMRYTGGEFNDDSSPTLATVWGYIEQCSNQEMKQNLRDSMILKLAEIAIQNPCSDGIIQRILDIPTAIDFSLPQDIPEEEVLTELAQMAGNINDYFEENYAFDCTGARAAAGDDETSPARIAVEAMISDLKRGMFLEKARIELVVLRNIDSNFVMDKADKVFPKGAILL